MPADSLAHSLARNSPEKPGRGVALAMLMVGAFYFVATTIILLKIGAQSRAASDQQDFHLPVIRQFIAQWPHVDLSDYASSTTPGYHLTVAGLALVFGSSTVALRFYGSIFTAALLGLLGFYVGSRMRFAWALAVCLPVACSVYVISSGTFLLPDNAGWLGVLCVMLLALCPRVDRWTFLGGGLYLLAAVLVRQICAWLIGPLFIAMFPWEDKTEASTSSTGATASAVAALNASRLAKILLAIAPSILALLWFAHLWHGSLVPPNQRALTTGFAPAGPAIILAIAGVVGVFYAGFLIPYLKRASTLLLSGAAAGAIIGILPITTYDMSARRYGGLWIVVKFFSRYVPYVMQRSPLIVVMAALGGAVVAAWLGSMPRRQGWIWGAAVLAFAAAQLASANPWQRYYEPFILLAAAITAPLLNREAQRIPQWAPLGPLALGLLCAAATVKGLW